MAKNCALGLECDRGRTFKRHRTQFFPTWTDLDQ